ncbi:hypothetical protein F9K97_24275 [Brucella anthropi]|uniref:hypothetical protein n=1 Tax=Brucella TaxID=234 RepID=UPI00124E9454|nr:MULTISPECIES: hypothetical protein [Brucella]KAB2716400.1 hypothetical protein F9K73_20370 [Brucella intermedia]KAB2775236.1 hypothetical protein F9K97_24275 [Brucella anthropi]
MEDLTKAAEAFRAAMANTRPEKLPVTLQEFPHGTCGDATLLLGYYLKTHGFGTFDYVLGMATDDDRERYSHAWLRQGRIVVDITADQFPDQAPVIVTDRSPWHDGFEVEVPHEADFHVYDGHTAAMLGVAYKAVIETLES